MVAKLIIRISIIITISSVLVIKKDDYINHNTIDIYNDQPKDKNIPTKTLTCNDYVACQTQKTLEYTQPSSTSPTTIITASSHLIANDLLPIPTLTLPLPSLENSNFVQNLPQYIFPKLDKNNFEKIDKLTNNNKFDIKFGNYKLINLIPEQSDINNNNNNSIVGEEDDNDYAEYREENYLPPMSAYE